MILSRLIMLLNHFNQPHQSIFTLSRTGLLTLLCLAFFTAHTAAHGLLPATSATTFNQNISRSRPRQQNDNLTRGSVRRENRRRRGNQARALVRRLNLTPLQIRRLRDIRRASVGERQALAMRLRQAQQALDDAVFSDAANESFIENHVLRVAGLQADLTRLRALTELKVRRLLTPEQLQNLRALREQTIRSREQNSPDADIEANQP